MFAYVRLVHGCDAEAPNMHTRDLRQIHWNISRLYIHGLSNTTVITLLLMSQFS